MLLSTLIPDFDSVVRYIKEKRKTLVGVSIIAALLLSILGYAVILVIDLISQIGPDQLLPIVVGAFQSTPVQNAAATVALLYWVYTRIIRKHDDDWRGGGSPVEADEEHEPSQEQVISVTVEVEGTVIETDYVTSTRMDIDEIVDRIHKSLGETVEESMRDSLHSDEDFQTDGGGPEKAAETKRDHTRPQGVPHVLQPTAASPIDQVSRTVPIRIIVGWMFVKSLFDPNPTEVNITVYWAFFALLLVGAFIILVRRTSPDPTRYFLTDIRKLPHELDDRRISHMTLSFVTLVIWAFSLGEPFDTLPLYSETIATAVLGLYTIVFLPSLLGDYPQDSPVYSTG
ncbi:hypothetical protein [Salinigranum salinum]|uniref:hypothetical protein n=1 Tax=Salinigranum salinum TaxID=1364937 RepID=UPI00126058CD|nr:hypothetical protein [Salinigranum salinum]